MSEGVQRSAANAEQLALRVLTADFLTSCEKLPPCWYRVDSRQNNVLADGKTNALLPSVADLFGMTDERATDLLLACGLMKRHGKKLQVDAASWGKLKTEYCLDIENETSTQAKLLGRKVGGRPQWSCSARHARKSNLGCYRT
jgi:hypothetical protein